jgi:hypothetical protein
MERRDDVTTEYDVAVDFMDMTDDRHLWARRSDSRNGLRAEVGSYVIVGDEDADPRVARIVEVDPDGNIELEVLPGSVEANRGLVTRA